LAPLAFVTAPSNGFVQKLIAFFLLQKTRLAEAERWFQRAETAAPRDPSVGLHYGLFLLDAGRALEAAKRFSRASHSTGDSGDNAYEIAFNAAVAYRLAGNNPLAEDFYRKAKELRPRDPSAHMNLGAMLHLVGKLSEAEHHYAEAWRLNPGDASTATNLRRLHSAMRAKGLAVRAVDGL